MKGRGRPPACRETALNLNVVTGITLWKKTSLSLVRPRTSHITVQRGGRLSGAGGRKQGNAATGYGGGGANRGLLVDRG